MLHCEAEVQQWTCTRERRAADSGHIALARDLIVEAHMADVLSILTTPFFDLVDLALESPLAVAVVLVLLGVAVFALVV
jgi:hypothetical protein